TGLADDLADALDVGIGVAPGDRAFGADQGRGLRLLGVVPPAHGDDGAFDAHRLEHARRAARGELGQVQVGDAEEAGQVLPPPGVPDALGDAGGFELALLPRELAVADDQVDRVRVRAQDVDDGLDELFGEAAVQVLADGREHDGLLGNAVRGALRRGAQRRVDVHAFQHVLGLDPAALPVLAVGFVADGVEVRHARDAGAVHRRPSAQIDL